MRSTKDKLKSLDRSIKKEWQSIDSSSGLSTRQKLEKLVQLKLRRQSAKPRTGSEEVEEPSVKEELAAVIVRDFAYPLDATYRRLKLREWLTIDGGGLALLANSPDFAAVDPLRLVFFDSETTGLAGGTGTIPFMLGFGFIAGESFQARIFVLTDLAREGELLDQVDEFLKSRDFSGLVTFNGKAFDMPLLEARYVLQRRRCPLLRLPHLDFLFPARAIWRHTYESRRLGFLADTLLGISRGEDIDSSEIPGLYFSFLRTRRFFLMEPIIEHNALDLLSLSATLLLSLVYLRDYSLTADEGEILGLATIFERAGIFDRAGELYRLLKASAGREPVRTSAVRRLALLLKKQKLFAEAVELWQILAQAQQHLGFRELSVHYEHREKDPVQALEIVQVAIDSCGLDVRARDEMEKRMRRLRRKIERLQKEDEQAD